MENLDKISKNLAIVKLLDAQIAGVEKLALQLANTDNIIYFNLSVEDLNAPPKPSTLREILEDRFQGTGMVFSIMHEPPMPKLDPGELHKFKLDTSTTLMCLSLMLQSFRDRKDAILKEVQSLMSA